jgi:multiple sugar transport system permease protein
MLTPLVKERLLLTTLASPPAVPKNVPRTMGRMRHRNRWTGWGFVGPFMIVFALVFLAPIIYSLYLSLFQTKLVGGTSFVGLDNYARALGDPQFWDGVGRVTLFLAVQVPVMLGISLLVALAIDSGRLYGRDFFRLTIFLPYAVPGVVAALMWGFMYGDRFGLVGNVNDLLGTAIPDPLASVLVLPAIGNIVTWEFVGYNMLIFYSALRVVPASLYEAAEIDGAGPWRVISAIKLPAIRGALVVATIFSIIGSFQLFNEPSILQALSPNYISTHYTPNLYAYSLSFSGQQYNYSATVAIIMGVLTMLVAYVVQLRGMRKEA